MKSIKIIASIFILSTFCFSEFYIKAEDTSQLIGDINGDFKVNVSDLNLLENYYFKNGNFSSEYMPNADINKDGLITGFDISEFRKKILKVFPIDEDAVLEPKGTVHYGNATFYGGGYEGGCAMLDPVSHDYWITAMNIYDYDNALLAGAYLKVKGELGTINVLVTDLLPEGQKGDLDLYVDAFPLIAPAEKGCVPVSWEIVPLDIADSVSVSYRFKEGSTEYWCGVQVLDHRYPIAKLEYLNLDGEFIEIARRHYNYFESSDMGAGPFTFRITDIYGQVVIDYDIPFVNDEKIPGNVQFPK